MSELDFSDFQEIDEIDEENYHKTPDQYLREPDTKPFPFMTMEPLEPEFYPPVAELVKTVEGVVAEINSAQPGMSMKLHAYHALHEGVIVDMFVERHTAEGSLPGIAIDIGQPWFYEVEEKEPLHFVESEPRTASRGMEFKQRCVELLGHK